MQTLSSYNLKIQKDSCDFNDFVMKSVEANLHICCKIFPMPVLSTIRNMHQNISFTAILIVLLLVLLMMMMLLLRLFKKEKNNTSIDNKINHNK